MKRRPILVLATAGSLLVFALMGAQKKPPFLLLDWAGKAAPEKAPLALVIEMGLKDAKPTTWSGQAALRGARVVRREGYHFGEMDQLVDPSSWKATSHRRPPQLVGVVLHLADVQPNATLVLDAGENNPQATVALADLVAGQTKLLWEGKASVRRLATATPVVTAKTEDDFPAAAYGPDGTLWLASISYTLKEEQRRLPYTEMPDQPKDFRSYYTPEFGDQLFVKYYQQGKWSEPLAVTGPSEDLVRCAIGIEGSGQVWVVYSANRQGNYDLYARSISSGAASARLGPERRLTTNTGPDITPAICTSQDGRLYLAYQSWSTNGAAHIGVSVCRDGTWQEGPVLPGASKGNNRWYPALAASADGKVAIAYDVYQDGDYDVHVAVIDGGHVTDYPVAASSLFEARPALAYDAAGRLWIAYEEGPERWGKNFGALETDRGSPLYDARSVRVACLMNGKLYKPAAELPTSRKGDEGERRNRAVRYAYPRLGLDDQGRLWLSYRLKLPTPFGVQPGTTWLTEARRLDGDRWTEPLEVHHSDGMLDSRPVLLPHTGGGLLVFTNTDGRHTTPGVLDNQVYAAVVDLPGAAVEPKIVPQQSGKKQNAGEAEERQAIARLRGHRLEIGGRKYQLLRGEFHRHTEISFDGGNDGSLEDMFRYAIDVAALDWIGNTDHDSGAGREYPWWLIQKYSDAYHVPQAFTPLFAYERSITYPMGHRNCLFARRGIRPLPRLEEADEKKRVAGVSPDDTRMLYRYLKEQGGICASHTSATRMGTDWRDNDPVFEPVVEIYQGDRNSYEMEGAPRAGYDPQSDKKPANIGGWYPKGYINLALEKGYRFGFQSSSDHISTHISYCVALAEEDSREGILAAIKKRHCYAATEDILLELRSGTHLMGDEFTTAEAPTLNFRVVGVKDIARLDILKDSAVVATIKPGRPEYKGTWTDPKQTRGAHYYYIRAEQTDGELAWSSPLWIDFKP